MFIYLFSRLKRKINCWKKELFWDTIKTCNLLICFHIWHTWTTLLSICNHKYHLKRKRALRAFKWELVYLQIQLPRLIAGQCILKASIIVCNKCMLCIHTHLCFVRGIFNCFVFRWCSTIYQIPNIAWNRICCVAVSLHWGCNLLSIKTLSVFLIFLTGKCSGAMHFMSRCYLHFTAWRVTWHS